MRSPKYQVYVSGTPRPSRARTVTDEEEACIQGDGAGYGPEPEIPRATVGASPRPLVRRFPPVLQFLTQVDPLVEQQMHTIVVQAHRKGMTLNQICEEVYYHARSLGYEATLGIQEVYSAGMPSFPNQTVMSALLLVDLQRIQAPEGYHQGRRARGVARGA